MKNHSPKRIISQIANFFSLICGPTNSNKNQRFALVAVRVKSMLAGLMVLSAANQVAAQCCAAGTSGMTQYSQVLTPSAVVSQTGAGTAWTNTSGALTAGDGSQAGNTGIGLDVLGILTAQSQTLNLTIPAYAIPAGRRFCSATISYTISSSIVGYTVNLPFPLPDLVVPALNLGSYVNVTTTPATVTQANITSGFTASISAAYGFTGTGLMSISLDAVTVTVVTQSGCPLPVELDNFSGVQEGNCAKLNWSTYSEVNNDYFTIQKLVGEQFIDIARVNSLHGTTLDRSEYEYTDCDVSPINYYRLMQTDKNGSPETIGELVAVAIDMPDPVQLTVVPNPSDNFTCVYAEDEILQLRLVSPEGRIVRDEVLQGDEKQHCMSIDELPAGVYTVQVETVKGMVSKKLVVV